MYVQIYKGKDYAAHHQDDGENAIRGFPNGKEYVKFQYDGTIKI